MARRRGGERTVFLPWERQGTLLRRLGLSRLRYFVTALVVVLLLVIVALRERRDADVRTTRATLLVARRAVDDFRADHDGECPHGDLAELARAGYLREPPRDAWERPLRLVCPSRRADKPYDLLSDGPDGEPWGLDRVE
jgi:general secretion pathway protein G